MWRIYGLVDSRDGRIRYVGCTTLKWLSSRLAAHVDQAKNPERRGYKARRSEWIREVLTNGHRPQVIHLQTAFSKEEATEREREWIARFRDQLVNDSSGGPGAPDPSPEARTKMSEAARGWWAALSDEERAVKGQQTKNWINSLPAEILKKRMDDARAKSHSVEANAKRSQSLKGRPLSPEHIEKMRQSKLGIKHSEETRRKRAESIRAFHVARRVDDKDSELPLFCPKCQQTLQKRDFNIHRKRTSGRQTYCRSCSVKYSRRKE